MTDRPIIYWQDETLYPGLELRSNDPERLTSVCALSAASTGDDAASLLIHLTRDQARSLGYALIARATVTSGEEQEQERHRKAHHDMMLAETMMSHDNN